MEEEERVRFSLISNDVLFHAIRAAQHDYIMRTGLEPTKLVVGLAVSRELNRLGADKYNCKPDEIDVTEIFGMKIQRLRDTDIMVASTDTLVATEPGKSVHVLR